MSKHAPDHHDADLVLRLYDLRREPVMRASRDAINAEFWPEDVDEAYACILPLPTNHIARAQVHLIINLSRW